MSLTTTDMRDAFERVFGAKFTNMVWRTEADAWSKCWHECSRLFHEKTAALEQQLNEKTRRIVELERRLERATGRIAK